MFLQFLGINKASAPAYSEVMQFECFFTVAGDNGTTKVVSTSAPPMCKLN
jgi:hypothetical protein